MNCQKLSACLVVKNEEKHLHRCLTSIKEAVDEIIVVDTGSTDKTVDIARQFTDRVFSIKWRNDFSKARNHALAKASCDWIFFLDGDEELDPQSIIPLKEKIQQSDSEGYLIKVLNYYQAGQELELAPDVIFRLFRNKKDYRYSGAIHEQIWDNIVAVNPRAKILIAEDICIIHYGYLPEEIAEKNKSERNTRLLQKSLQKNPGNLLNRFHLGVEYYRINRLDKALTEFLFVLDRVDWQAFYVPKLMRYIASCYYLMGDFPASLKFIDDIWAKAYKDHGDLYYLRGMVCKKLGNKPESYTSFKACLALPPQPPHYANLYCQHREKIYQQLTELGITTFSTQPT